MQRVETMSDYQQIAQRFVALQEMRRQRVLEVLRQSGAHDFIRMHNAFVSAEYGKPWPEIDYSLLRKARWMWNRIDLGREAVDRLYNKACVRQYPKDWAIHRFAAEKLAQS